MIINIPFWLYAGSLRCLDSDFDYFWVIWCKCLTNGVNTYLDINDINMEKWNNKVNLAPQRPVVADTVPQKIHSNFWPIHQAMNKVSLLPPSKKVAVW